MILPLHICMRYTRITAHLDLERVRKHLLCSMRFAPRWCALCECYFSSGARAQRGILRWCVSRWILRRDVETAATRPLSVSRRDPRARIPRVRFLNPEFTAPASHNSPNYDGSYTTGSHVDREKQTRESLRPRELLLYNNNIYPREMLFV